MIVLDASVIIDAIIKPRRKRLTNYWKTVKKT